MQIATGIKVSGEVYFPRLREYCPRADLMLFSVIKVILVQIKF